MPLIEARHVTKRFGSFAANEAIDLVIAPGEIHALLGENGAGKSTLVKMIYGLLRPDEGSLRWQDQPVSIASPRAARRLGIAMVFQHFSLFDALTVLENLALGQDDPEPMPVLAERVRTLGQTFGLTLDLDRRVHTLSAGERQRIEIVRCLLQSPKLLILDEPTSVLTPQEADLLFRTLRLLSAAGCAVLYISHKLGEIKALCHAVTVLRAGRVVATCDPAVTSVAEMAQLMIGGTVRVIEPRPPGDAGAPVRLSVDTLSLPSPGLGGIGLDAIGFEVRAGEILGIAGVAGNGQSELQLALSGERRSARDEAVRLDGQPVGRRGVGWRRRAGLCAVPEERNGHAAVPGFSLIENAILTGHQRARLARYGFVDSAKASRFTRRVIGDFDVRAAGPLALASSLSGGNLQKFIVGRELTQTPAVLVVAQPTWGVDRAAAAAIHAALQALAATGAALVIISQDLDELLLLSDRIAVLNLGRLSAAMPRDTLSIEALGLLMGGVGHEAPPALAKAG